MRQALITGATGLVGGHLAEELARGGEWRLRLFSRSGQAPLPPGDAVEVFRGDLFDLDDCRRALQGVEVVFHCAAQVQVGRIRGGEQLVREHVEMTHNLLVAAAEQPTPPLFVHVSSIAALGRVDPPARVDETTLFGSIGTQSPYSRAKFLAENEVWRAAAHGLRVVVASPAVIWGERPGGKTPPLVRAIRRTAACGVWIDGTIGLVSARDVARALVALAETPSAWGERYLLCSENVPVRSLIEQVGGKPRLHLPGWLLRTGARIAPVLDAAADLTLLYDGSKITRATPFRYTQAVEKAEGV